ncbi:hypothetical protein [Rothia uropygialis]|uniref:hypothetical protein n=1 Tax=Kocuria sp. 36 TaxID=1415402 RepID=UPI00101BAC17|nr:hypothetical protein [Kocuria sp. 36]
MTTPWNASLREWCIFGLAPAQSTGAFQVGWGAVPAGSATVRASTSQQRIDTEEIARLEAELQGAGEIYGGAMLAAVPLRAEIAHLWAHVSSAAAMAAQELDEAQKLLLSLGSSVAEYGAKLHLARTSYEEAENLAEVLVSGFDAVHCLPYRHLYGSAMLSGGNPLGLLAAVGAFAVTGGAILAADASVRGTAAATRSSIKGSGIPLEHLRLDVARVKQLRRRMGLGLVRLRDFRQVEASPMTVMSEAANVSTIAEGLKNAGERDIVHDAAHGPQNRVSLAHIDVKVVHRPDGTKSFVVSIPGTDFDNLSSRTDPDGAHSILDVVTTSPGTPLSESPGLMQMVDRALQEAGAGSTDPVILSGFSQGGMTAMSLASNREFSGRYTIRGVVTTGTPTVTYRGVDPKTKVLHLADVNDPVPVLTGGGSDPGNNHAVVVTSNVGKGGAIQMTHDAETYVRAARVADRELSRTTEGRKQRRMIQEAIPAGASVQTLTFEASSESYDRRTK